MSTDSVPSHLERIATDGYTVLERVIDRSLVEALNEALLRLEHDRRIVPGGNLFEGDRTIRIYNLLALDRVFEAIPVHPAASRDTMKQHLNLRSSLIKLYVHQPILSIIHINSYLFWSLQTSLPSRGTGHFSGS